MLLFPYRDFYRGDFRLFYDPTGISCGLNAPISTFFIMFILFYPSYFFVGFPLLTRVSRDDLPEICGNLALLLLENSY